MSDQYTHILDLAQAATPPEHGILSHTIFQNDSLKAMVFGFGAGDELSEHTAAKPAILHFLQGEAELSLGEEKQIAVQAGSWTHMKAHLPHTIVAKTPTIMLLLLLKG